MTKIIDTYNALVGAAVALLTAIFCSRPICC